MDREAVKQRLLDEFERRGVVPPTWVDIMASVVADDPRCTLSEKRLRECVENAVDAYVYELLEREVLRRELEKALGTANASGKAAKRRKVHGGW